MDLTIPSAGTTWGGIGSTVGASLTGLTVKWNVFVPSRAPSEATMERNAGPNWLVLGVMMRDRSDPVPLNITLDESTKLELEDNTAKERESRAVSYTHLTLPTSDLV